jgi:hypothetical protein
LFFVCLSRENNITTFFIVPPPNRRKPFLFNTLNVRNNLMTGGKEDFIMAWELSEGSGPCILFREFFDNSRRQGHMSSS